MNDYKRLAFPLVAALSFCASALQAEDVSESDKAKADQWMADYTANRLVFDRFAVAFRFESTVIYDRTSERNSAVVEWYLICVDRDAAIERHDRLKHSVDGELVGLGNMHTLLVTPDKIDQRFFRGQTYTADLTSTKGALLKVPIRRFDPWDLPLGDLTVLSARRSPDRSLGRVEETFIPSGLTKFERMLKQTECHFHYLPATEYHKAIIFDNETGLPVKTLGYKLMEDGTKYPFSSVVTEWGRTSNKNWLPHKLLMTGIGGLPSNPSTEYTHEIEAYWVLNESFPKSVFEKEPFMTPAVLRDQIVDFAEELKVSR